MNQRKEALNQSINVILSRYESILPNVDQFRTVSLSPLPSVGWVNSLRASLENVGDLLETRDFSPLAWCSNGFRVQEGGMLGKTWLYRTGLIQVQEEVSMLPVFALRPSPHDCVLDMCAAPGNKTAQLSVAMRNHGTIVANDVQYQRLRALGQITQRLGLVNINFHVGDGTSLSCKKPVFDKILVDAPCSCEGTFRKGNGRVISSHQAQSTHMASTQIALLKKAMQLLKPGGRMVYSTCTFAPEENECVVDSILKQFEGELELKDIDIPHFKFEPGITEWQGRALSPELKKTWRIWPHLNNTGGFYIALFEKKGGAVDEPIEMRADLRFEHDSGVDSMVKDAMKVFGLSQDDREQFVYYKTSNRGIYASHKSNLALYRNALSSFNFDAMGLFFLKTKIRYPKLSSAASLLVGPYATKSMVSLDAEQLQSYLEKRDVLLKPSQRTACKKTGYVIVKHRGFVVGQGLLFQREEHQEWPMRSLFPGYW